MNYTTVDKLISEVHDASLVWRKVAKYIDTLDFFTYCNYEEMIENHLKEVNLESREIGDLSNILVAISDITYDLDTAIETISRSVKSHREIRDNIRGECGFVFSELIRESNRTAVMLQIEINNAHKLEKIELERVKFSEYKLMHNTRLQSQKISAMLESEKQLHAIVSHLSTSEYNKTIEIQEMAAQIEELKRKLAKAKKPRSPKTTHRNIRRE
jgi:hypothetical protein